MDTNLLEEIKQKAILLKPNEQMALADFLQENVQQKVSQNQNISNGASDKMRRREQQWLEKHRAEFAGQWVALDGETVLSYGTDGRKVYAEAKAKGIEVPFVVHLEPLDELPFGGW